MTALAMPVDTPTPARTLADVLEAMPEDESWEIVRGGLYMQTAGAPKHNYARDGLIELLRAPYDRGRGGPGGWWILAEQRFYGPDPNQFALEPDVAGWRKERLPSLDAPRIDMAPDWACEVVSPSSRERDYGAKMRAYETLGAPWLWIVDPDARKIQVFQLVGGLYSPVGGRAPGDPIEPLAPFAAAAVDPDVVFV